MNSPALFSGIEWLGVIALEVSVVVLLTMILDRRIESARWRRAGWHACFLGLLLLVAGELTGAARTVSHWLNHSSTVHNESAASSIASAAGIEPEQPTAAQTFMMGPADSSPALVLENGATSPSPIAAGNPLRNTPVISSGMMPAAPRIPASRSGALKLADTLLAIFAGLWLIGCLLVLGRRFVARVIFEFVRREHKVVLDAGLREIMGRLIRQMKVRRAVRLVSSRRFVSPITFGLVRPTIGLPQNFQSDFNAEQREAIMAHEMAHLAGWDAAWYPLANLLTAILWWHPLVWLARRRLRAATELAADEASLMLDNGPAILAECLVRLGTTMTRRQAFGTMGFSGNDFRSGLGRRVDRLLNLEGGSWQPPRQSSLWIARTAGPLALAGLTIICTAWAVPPAVNQGDTMKSIKQTWQKSLAAIGLLATVNTEALLAQNPTPEPPPTAPAGSASFEQVQQYGIAPEPQQPAASPKPPRPGTPFFAKSNRANSPQHGAAIRPRLESIVLDKVMYDNLPLSEVILHLVEQSAAQDPSKQGINFVLDRGATNPGGVIDPTTGLPTVTAVDLGSITVKIVPALRNVRLIDVLEVITKGAEQPIKFSIEDYGILFSSDDGRTLPVWAKSRQPDEVQTYKVDAKSFFDNLHDSFGGARGESESVSLAHLLHELGINQPADPAHRAIYYNAQTGIIMARVSPPDMPVLTAAIQMLGGSTTAPLSKGRPGMGGQSTFNERLNEIVKRGGADYGTGGGGGFGGGSFGAGGPMTPDQQRVMIEAQREAALQSGKQILPPARMAPAVPPMRTPPGAVDPATGLPATPKPFGASIPPGIDPATGLPVTPNQPTANTAQPK